MLTGNLSNCQSPNPDLIYEEACLDIVNNLSSTVNVTGQYDECDGCKFQILASIEPGCNASIVINTDYSLTVNYTNNDNNSTCRLNKLFYEHYRYGWNISEKCNPIYIKKSAANAYLPVLFAFIILFAVGAIWYMFKCIHKRARSSEIWKRHFTRSDELEYDLESPIRKHPHRVKSIDVFRGMCTLLMIFINYGGGQYWFFRHSIWNGLTIADLVFPCFLWIMGFSLTISLNNRLHQAVPHSQLFIQIIRRSVILLQLGIIINMRSSTLDSMKLTGILQRIGITYLIVGLIEITFAKRSLSVKEYDRLSYLQYILVAVPQWMIMVIMIIIHTTITFLLEVPGCGRGYLGPGGLHDGGLYYNCSGGAAGYIDRLVFGVRMKRSLAGYGVYNGVVYYDDDGILGTFTSVVVVYLGVQAGLIFHTYSNAKTRVIRLVTCGVVVALLGGILCGFSKNHGVIPINRHLWSLSFALTTGGIAFLIEALLFMTVDILHKWSGWPLFYPGMNPIFLYVGYELFWKVFPFHWTPINETHATYLSINLWGTCLWLVVSMFLYKKNIFLSI